MSRLLTVFGATGLQGGSLIRYVIGHTKLSQQYRVRGVTRDPSKPAAEQLRQQGVEMVKADMNDPTSLVEAVKGSYAVFAVTNFWEHMSADTEIAQGKAMADAAVAARAELIIWSSLPASSTITDGRITYLVHFDSKALVEEYIRTLPIKGVFFQAGFYMQNTQTFIRPQVTDSGDNVIKFLYPPEAEWPLIDIDDTGAYVAPALLKPEDFEGKRLMAASQYMGMGEMVDVLTAVTGKKFRYEHADEGAKSIREVFPPPMAEFLIGIGGEAIGSDSTYYGPEGKAGIKWTKDRVEEFGGKLTTWEEFVKKSFLSK